jgi:hypothetical protein
MRQLRTENATDVSANFLTRRVQKDYLIPLPIKENEYAAT